MVRTDMTQPRKQDIKPLISIIVPVYNILEYLPRCVESLQRQTYSQLEILLVDDGSTDGTGALCDQMAAQDERIRVFHKENGGSSSARNLGLEQAKGEYVGFVDSDDYVEPDMYENLMAAVLKYGVKAAQVGRDELDEEGNRLPDICIPPEKTELIEPEDFLRELLLHKGDCSFCTKLLKKELFAEQSFPMGVLNEDFHLLVLLLPLIGQIASLPQRGYHVFCRMGSNTRRKQGFSRVFADNVQNADMVMKLVERDYPALLKIAFRFGVFQRLDYLLHIPVEEMNRKNAQYCAVVAWMRQNWIRSMGNPYLTRKNKCYHTLFAIAPRTLRTVHRRLRKPKE